jgi:hypothetical protein
MLGSATTPDPNSLDLATISSPSVIGLERLQTQAAWVWRGCQTLIIPKFRPPQWLKNQGWCFFFRNSFSIHFQPQTPINHPNNLFKPIFNLQKRKKLVKNPKSTRKPISSRSQIWFLGTFKVKNHPSQTFLVIWNHLRKKSNILVVGIEEMIFFSLHARFQPSSLSLSSHTLRTEK